MSPTVLRLAFGAVWAAVLVGAAGFLSFEMAPSMGQIPDPIHIAAHLALLGVLAGVLVRDLSPRTTLLLVLVAGALVEVVQMAGVGVLLLREARFDLGVDLLGACIGLRLAGGPEGAVLVRSVLHPVLVAGVALVALGVPSLGLVGVAATLGVVGLRWGRHWPWSVIVPLALAVPMAWVTPRGAGCLCVVAALRTPDAPGPSSPWWALAWIVACVAWAAG
ncbi:MAG: hypothetical protein R3F61_03105 [Myxococcota bacterium]